VVDGAAHGCQSVLGRLFIDRSPGRTSADGDEFPCCVDGDSIQMGGEVDDEPALGRGCTRAGVSATLDS
jgi:hypothetical protein